MEIRGFNEPENELKRASFFPPLPTFFSEKESISGLGKEAAEEQADSGKEQEKEEEEKEEEREATLHLSECPEKPKLYFAWQKYFSFAKMLSNEPLYDFQINWDPSLG